MKPIIWFNDNTITIPAKCIIYLQSIDYIKLIHVHKSGLFIQIKSSDIPVLGSIKLPIENDIENTEDITTKIENYCFMKSINFIPVRDKFEKRKTARIMNHN